MPDFLDLALPEILRLLAQRIGLRADSVGDLHLRTAISEHMQSLALEDATDYAKRLVEPSIFDDLIERVVVPETWFFRDLDPFRCLQRIAQRYLADRQSGATSSASLRVLSVPCSTGEEPYSIALTLMDLGLQAGQFHVDGIDISQRNIERARAARYSRNSFRERSGFLSRSLESFFDLIPGEARLQLQRSVREAVQFRRGNLAASDFLLEAASYHVVFCRNLLIYLTPEARDSAIQHFQRLLVPGGVLYLGHAESAVGSTSLLEADAEYPFAFRFRRSVSGSLRSTPTSSPGERSREVTVSSPASQREATPQGSTARSSPASRLRPSKGASTFKAPPSNASQAASDRTPLRLSATSTIEAVQPQRDDAKHWLAAAQAAANAGQLDEAVHLCNHYLGANVPSVAALCLLGTIRQAQGQLTQAEQCFQKALYLDPQHYESLIHLSLIAQSKGDSTSAANFKRRAERAASRQ